MESQVTDAIVEVATDPNLNNGFDIKAFLEYEIGGFKIGNILYAAIVLIVGLIIKKIIDGLIAKGLKKSGANAKVSKGIQKIADVLIVFILIMITASALGVNTASIITIAAVLSLSVVLALNDILGNIASGLEVKASKIFSNGDFIEIDGIQGFVILMNLTHTKIRTVDNNIILIPNKEISSKSIVNYYTNKTRRITIAVTASYDSPTEMVERALLESAKEEPAVLSNPEPFVFLTNYLESSIEYTLYFWLPSTNWWEPKMHINRRIREKFDEHKVEMSYNHINVHMV